MNLITWHLNIIYNMCTQIIIAEECAARWTALRERYGRELKKRNKPSGSGTEDSKPEWEFMKILSFLQPFIKPRR